MELDKSIEGTGEEIARYASEHPAEHFVLTPVEANAGAASKREAMLHALEVFEKFRGKLPILPIGATSTENLYD